jgi:hypothetical protein
VPIRPLGKTACSRLAPVVVGTTISGSIRSNVIPQPFERRPQRCRMPEPTYGLKTRQPLSRDMMGHAAPNKCVEQGVERAKSINENNGSVQRHRLARNDVAGRAPGGVPASLKVGGTRASRRSTVAILGRVPRFHLRHCLRIRAASSSRPGRSAWRAGYPTSRGQRLRAAAAGRHSLLRLQDRL